MKNSIGLILSLFLCCCAMNALANGDGADLGQKQLQASPPAVLEPVSPLQTRIGSWAQFPGQHPIMTNPFAKDPESQEYINVCEGEASGTQLVVFVPKSLKVEIKPGQKVVLKGTIRVYSMGGAEGTKNSYKNEVMDLKSCDPAK